MGIPIFKENTDHTVYKNDKDLVVPSITTVLKVISKPELIHWANWLGYKRKSVKSELEMAGYIGDMTHKLIETYTTTGDCSFDILDKRGPVERLSVKYAFSSFLQFYVKERLNIEILDTEFQLAGEKCGGTSDLLANYKHKLTLGDYKTSKAFYPSMFLQLAGYDTLMRELRDVKVDQYMIVLLDKKTGNTATVKMCDDKEEMKQYRECFKRLVDFYHDWYYINQTYWGKELID
jgi:hypothetical protein